MCRSSSSGSASGYCSISAYRPCTLSALRTCACGSAASTARCRASRNSGWSSAIRMSGIKGASINPVGAASAAMLLLIAEDLSRLKPLLRLFDQPFLDEALHHRGIGEGGDVAELVGLVLADLAQDAAHDLARAGLGQAGRPLDVVGRGDRADLLAHPGDQFLLQLVGAGAVAADVDHVVDAAGDPVVAVLVAARAVAGEVVAGVGAEIGLDEALVVAV